MGRFSLRSTLTVHAVGGAILVVAALRLAFAAMIPLTEDEAYYRLWSMRLQLGYFDHPPMIAWWIAAGRALVGDNAMGVRLLPVLANAATGFLLIDTLRALGAGERAALRAGLWLNATLLLGAGGMLAIPDSPTTLFWMTTLWALSLASRSGTATATVLGWWVVVGVSAGLAVMSKYSALFLGPGILLWLCVSAENRRRLLTPGPWLAVVAALVVVSPHIGWNALNGWVSVLKQFGRVQPGPFEPEHMAELIVSLALLLNPIIAVFAVLAIVNRRWAILKTPAVLLWMSGLPFLAYLLLHSLHDSVQAHWLAPVYPALVGWAAIGADAVRPGAAWPRRWRRAVPHLGFGLVGLMLALAAWPALDGLSGPAVRPLRGWSPFAADLEALTIRAPAGQSRIAWVGTASYGLAAQLSAESGLTVPVVQLNDRARYDPLPPVTSPDFRQPGLVIDLPRRLSAEALAACFADVETLNPMRRSTGGDRSESAVTYAVYRVARPRRIVSGGCQRERDFTTRSGTAARRSEAPDPHVH